MEKSAPQNRKNILIVNVGSFLGKSLSEYFLSRNHHIYGLSGRNVGSGLLSHKNFTLLDLDLNQPLPSHLPPFDLICLLMLDNLPQKEFLTGYNLTADILNILSYAKHNSSQVFVFSKLVQNPDLYDSLSRDFENKEQISLFLVGDLYGSEMDLKENDLLTQIITQSVTTDRIILENEGKSYTYPTNIYDVTSFIGKCLIEKANPVEYLVSNHPVTTLEIAYEIQKIEYTNHRDLGLFFAGLQDSAEGKSPIQVQTIPRATSLELGLKNTLSFLSARHSQKKEQDPPNIAWVPPRPAQLHPVQNLHHPAHVSQEPLMKKFKKHQIVIPKSPLKFIGSALVILLVVFLGKTILDTALGIKYLKSARSKIVSSDLNKASLEAKKAARSLELAESEISILLYPLNLIIPKKVMQINYTISASRKTASSIEALTIAALSLNRNLLTVSTPNSSQKSLDLVTPTINFQKAYSNSSQAHELLEKAKDLGIFTKQTNALMEANIKSANIAKQGEAITNLLTSVTGTQEPKTYLMLLQNNAELRPGGGFIGNIGLLEFADGRLKNVSVDDVYNLDGQLKEKIEPPKELAEKLGVDNFYLRDSNWSGDFPLNSQTARDFYKKVTGRNVDGVIAFDLSLTQNLLKIIGPIKLEEYNEEITGENLFDRGEFYSEIGFFPGSTQKKDFFGALSKNLIDDLISSLTDPSSSAKGLAILEAIHDGVLEKHLMFSFDDTSLTAYLKVNDLDRTLPPASFDPANDTFETRDFISLSEANIGANKVNRYVERNLEYEITVGRDADLVGKLSITYTNNSQAETWPGGKYANFLRVYLPAGTSLESYSQDPPPPPPAETVKTAKPKTPLSTDENSPVAVTAQGNLTVFSKYIEVPIKSSKTITFTYRIHKNIKLESAPTYHLYVQKQPGTEKDPFTFRFNLPNYLVAKTINKQDQPKPLQNFQIETDLLTDRQFEVEILKK